MTLTFFGDQGPIALDELIRSTRSGLFEVLVARLKNAVDDGELSQSTDIVELARFMQLIHSGMTVRSRDGTDQEELVLSNLWFLRQNGTTTVYRSCGTG